MEKMKVFGKQKLNFDAKDKQTGRPVHIEGIKLHCTKDAPNEKWEGEGYESLFVNVSKAELYSAAFTLPVGSTICVEFNRYGNFDGFRLDK